MNFKKIYLNARSHTERARPKGMEYGMPEGYTLLEMSDKNLLEILSFCRIIIQGHGYMKGENNLGHETGAISRAKASLIFSMLVFGTIAIFSYIDPIVAILLSAVFLKELLGIGGIVGAIMVLGAALISELPEKQIYTGGREA